MLASILKAEYCNNAIAIGTELKGIAVVDQRNDEED